MAGSKVDYRALKNEFIVTDISMSEMARREGISKGTLGVVYRREGWEKLRQEYRQKETTAVIRKTADDQAERLIRMADRSLDVLEAMLVRAATQLVGDPEHQIPPQEVPLQQAIEAIKLIHVMRGGVSDRTEENRVVGHVYDQRFLDALGELARRSLLDRGAGDPNLKLVSGGAQGSAGNSPGVAG